MNTKKKFTYEYDVGTEAIIKSLIGKSYIASKDIQRLFGGMIAEFLKRNMTQRGLRVNQENQGHPEEAATMLAINGQITGS